MWQPNEDGLLEYRAHPRTAADRRRELQEELNANKKQQASLDMREEELKKSLGRLREEQRKMLEKCLPSDRETTAMNELPSLVGAETRAKPHVMDIATTSKTSGNGLKLDVHCPNDNQRGLSFVEFKAAFSAACASMDKEKGTALCAPCGKVIKTIHYNRVLHHMVTHLAEREYLPFKCCVPNCYFEAVYQSYIKVHVMRHGIPWNEEVAKRCTSRENKKLFERLLSRRHA